MSIIALLSDFSQKDTYVAEMKGVILKIAPEATLIDLCHEIPPQNIVAGVYLLKRSIQVFPRNTIYLAVVDPGVGSSRRPLAISVGNAFFVGPDNGLLLEAAASLGEARAFCLENPEFQRKDPSPVFSGRDIFAPAAAHLSLGVPVESFGSPVNDPCWPRRAHLEFEKNEMTGEVLYIDHFGNLVTSIPQKVLPKNPRELTVEIGKEKIQKIFTHYSQVSKGELIALIGSAGMLEIAVFCGSAKSRIDAKPGTPVRVLWRNIEA